MSADRNEKLNDLFSKVTVLGFIIMAATTVVPLGFGALVEWGIKTPSEEVKHYIWGTVISATVIQFVWSLLIVVIGATSIDD